MHINGTTHIHGSHAIRGPHRTAAPATPNTAQPLVGNDRIDLSPEARALGQIGDLPEIRADRVANIRQQIEAGVYETSDKLDIAVGRLFDELAG